MDPNETYSILLAALIDSDRETAIELAHSLQEWLHRGGFYPSQAIPELTDLQISRVLSSDVELHPLFSLGMIVITPMAKSSLEPQCVQAALSRHANGDWGELEAEDRRSNDRAVLEGDRLLSAYVDSQETRFWIITEADRSSTCILLPEDY